MDDYHSNSYKHKEEQKKKTEEKKIDRVISGVAKTKKKSDVRKIADTFISEDVSKVKEYVVLDVLIPAIKKAVSDIVTNGIDMFLYGESSHTKKSNTPASKVSYRNYSNISDDRSRGYNSNTSRNTYSFDDIVLDSRGDAEAVIMQMDDLVASYGLVTVADLYDLVGVDGRYTDNNYGWTDIRSAQVIRVKDGYLLKLPKVLPID